MLISDDYTEMKICDAAYQEDFMPVLFSLDDAGVAADRLVSGFGQTSPLEHRWALLTRNF